MGESKIEWTERTWNPIAGCSITSPGCTHCYAMRMAARIEAMGSAPHYRGTTRKVKGKPVWTGRLAKAPDHIWREPLLVKKPAMWFVNSMSDLFHEDMPEAWIDRAFATMGLAHWHTFQVLTKRADRMHEYLSSLLVLGRIADLAQSMRTNTNAVGPLPHLGGGERWWPLSNVWLGASIERQQEDHRLAYLINTPAAVRFVSAEPLLGPLLLQHRELIDGKVRNWLGKGGVDWVIVGGESGPGARPMHHEWAMGIVRQCRAEDVPVFVKQLGAAYSNELDGIAGAQLKVSQDAAPLISRRLKSRKGGDMAEWPLALQVRQMPVAA